jgi:hypothetical protein
MDLKYTVRIESFVPRLIIDCPQCKRENKIPLEKVKPGSNITCSCGSAIQISREDLGEFCNAMGKMKETFKR